MGQSTNAILCYGINLGDDFDNLEPCPFLDAVEAAAEAARGSDDDYFDLTEWIADRLLTETFTEPDPHPELGYKPGDPDWEEHFAWYKRRAGAAGALHVELVRHCSGKYPMYILAARPVFTAYRGSPEAVDVAELAGKHASNARQAALEHAVDVLGMRPKNAPGWLLASYWG